MYNTAQVASCQPMLLTSLHPKPLISLSRQPRHFVSKAVFIEQLGISHSRCNAASESLDGPDDANFSESSFPPPPSPSRPTTEEPKDDIAKLIYHAGRFILYVTLVINGFYVLTHMISLIN
jgi:hypothetical protein